MRRTLWLGVLLVAGSLLLGVVACGWGGHYVGSYYDPYCDTWCDCFVDCDCFGCYEYCDCYWKRLEAGPEAGPAAEDAW